MMARIDDPYDAARSQEAPEESENVVGELALRISGVLFPWVAVVKAVQEHFSGRGKQERLQNLQDALNLKIKLVETQAQGNTQEIKAIRSKVESPKFHAAVVGAIEETGRTYDPEKVKHFAAIVGNCLDPEYKVEDLEHVSSFISAIAQLGDRDIQALEMLRSTYREVLAVNPNMHDPNAFTERITELFKELDRSKMKREEFYAYCARLGGFGLAMEVPRNPGRMSPGDYCFRPTSLGLKLLFLLRGRATGDQSS